MLTLETPKLLTRTELADRWGVKPATIDNWTSEGLIKKFKGKPYYSLTQIEALENEGVNLETVNVFAVRSRDRKIDQLEKELAIVKSKLLQVTMIASEGVSQLISNQAI